MKSMGYDVVIAGAGPAGATLAYLLSRESGLKIAVIDSRSWETLWGKPCGNAIGSHHFEETGLPRPVGDEVKQEIRGISIISPREDVVFKVFGEGFIIDRTRVGRRLMENAVSKGVDFFPKSHVLSPIIKDGFVKGVQARIKGERVSVEASITVEATGTASVIKKHLPREWPVSEPLDPKDSDIAYREILEFDHEVEDPEMIRIYLNQTIAPGGYWWFFPEGKNRANVGLGVQGGMGYPSPMKIYKEKLLQRKELRGIKKVLSAMGAPVPTRRPLDSLVWDGIVVLGDAAFTVNPVHGGGMGYSMLSAYAASKVIPQVMEKGDYSRKSLWGVNKIYMQMIGGKQASLEILRIFLQKLSDDDLQFVMEKKIVSEDDVDLLGRKGELKETTAERASRIVSDFFKALRVSRRPSLLVKLRTLSSYMKRIRSYYDECPEDPEKLPKWSMNVRELIKDFLRELE
jgi:digeranylgeranylglycerophospholipid reductase